MTQLGGKGALRSNDRKIQNTAPNPSTKAKICDQQQTDEISGLGNNRIESIPDGISDLRNLNDLSLMQNHLREIPEALFKLPLTRLNLCLSLIHI